MTETCECCGYRRYLPEESPICLECLERYGEEAEDVASRRAMDRDSYEAQRDEEVSDGPW